MSGGGTEIRVAAILVDAHLLERLRIADGKMKM